MGNDEVATRYAALLPLHLLARLLRHVDAVHGLYYLLMHGWMAVGTSPAVMRIPSVIAMTAAAALVAIIAWRLTGSGWAALFAGLIMALTPTISYYAQTARSYALVYLCVAGATLVLLHALGAEHAAAGPAPAGRPVLARWVAYAALIALAGYLNELSLMVLVAHGVTVLLARYGRRALVHWAAASAVAVVIVPPLAALSATEDKAVNWIPRPGLWSLRILFQDYFGASMIVAVLLLACAVVAVLPDQIGPRPAPSPAQPAPAQPAPGQPGGAGPAGPDLAPWWRRGGVSLPSVAAPLLVLPGAVLIAESLIARPLYVDRYVLYGEAGAALLAGAGAYRLGQWLATAAGRRELLWAPGAVVCVLALVLQLGPQHRARTPQSRLIRLRRPVPLPGGARPAGRRGAVLQRLLPQDAAGLPGRLPQRQRLLHGGLTRPGRRLPGPGQAVQRSPPAHARPPADLGGRPAALRAPGRRPGPRRGRVAQSAIHPCFPTALQGRLGHPVAPPLAHPASTALSSAAPRSAEVFSAVRVTGIPRRAAPMRTSIWCGASSP